MSLPKHEIFSFDGLVAGLNGLQVEAAFFLFLGLFVWRPISVSTLKKFFPGGLKVNLFSVVFDFLFVAPLLVYLISIISQWAGDGVWSFIDPGASKEFSWLMLCVALIFSDFVAYFRHRFEHSKSMWPSHEMHHSDRDMVWISLYRFHPFNRVSSSLIDVGVLLAIGFPWSIIVLNGIIRHCYGLLIHARINWTYGVLGRVFVSPSMHRWHHVRAGEGVGKNFATLFSVFDQIFGTYYVPGCCFEEVGTEAPEHDSFFAQLLAPFHLSKYK
ncbi:sterol desaturase family protein [Xanthomonas campestris]|uniref:sterol desaturase family protein n=1 Tax=Xanthomonas campestris TaxID=339 RepID=UPI00236792F1|nr:sterol desaturase family protein [Xanthomonas campestris]WDJ84232.1 sterol desaturase family protein [Xanthomonas campestris pv. incanae]